MASDGIESGNEASGFARCHPPGPPSAPSPQTRPPVPAFPVAPGAPRGRGCPLTAAGLGVACVRQAQCLDTPGGRPGPLPGSPSLSLGLTPCERRRHSSSGSHGATGWTPLPRSPRLCHRRPGYAPGGGWRGLPSRQGQPGLGLSLVGGTTAPRDRSRRAGHLGSHAPQRLLAKGVHSEPGARSGLPCGRHTVWRPVSLGTVLSASHGSRLTLATRAHPDPALPPPPDLLPFTAAPREEARARPGALLRPGTPVRPWAATPPVPPPLSAETGPRRLAPLRASAVSRARCRVPRSPRRPASAPPPQRVTRAISPLHGHLSPCSERNRCHAMTCACAPAPARGGAAPALAPKPAPLCTAHPARPAHPLLHRRPRPHVPRGFAQTPRVAGVLPGHLVPSQFVDRIEQVPCEPRGGARARRGGPATAAPFWDDRPFLFVARKALPQTQGLSC